MVTKPQRISDSKMIERILNTQETILEKQSDQGELLAKMPGMMKDVFTAMLSEHEKACEKKGVSIFRLQAPFVFNVSAGVALIWLILAGHSVYTDQKAISITNTESIEFLKHTVNSDKAESGT